MQSFLGGRAATPLQETALLHLLHDPLCPSELGARGTLDAQFVMNIKQRPAEMSVQLRAIQKEGDLSLK